MTKLNSAAVMLFTLLSSCSSVRAQPADDEVLVDAYAATVPSVVLVEVQGIDVDPNSLEITQLRGTGSGFAIQPGLVVTNYHVIEQATRVTVVLENGRSESAVLLGTAPQYDLALLRVPYSPESLPPARLGSSRSLRVGQRVLAISNPMGLSHSLSAGVVSGVSREIPWAGSSRGFIQFDAPINPGQSGGPLVDIRGQVVGVTTAKILGAEAIGFAIPIDLVTRIIPDLERMGHPFRPQIGFTGAVVNPDLAALFDLPAPWGVLVEEVDEGSVAAEIGLKAGERRVAIRGLEFVLGGDIIVAVDSNPIQGLHDLDAYLSEARPGQSLRLLLIGPEGKRSVDLTVPKMRH